jgi:hypothetical protein
MDLYDIDTFMYVLKLCINTIFKGMGNREAKRFTWGEVLGA